MTRTRCRNISRYRKVEGIVAVEARNTIKAISMWSIKSKMVKYRAQFLDPYINFYEGRYIRIQLYPYCIDIANSFLIKPICKPILKGSCSPNPVDQYLAAFRKAHRELNKREREG